MRPVTLAFTLSAVAAVAISAPSPRAQWSSDPAVNLPVGDAPSDQSQPKIVSTADGGCYVSWFDGIGTGYDVRLQKLDAGGNELWPHGGVLVRDRGFSSTQDYGLDLDASGAALLAFRDDNFTPVQITAQRVTSAGTLAWGAAGVQVAGTPGSVSSPKIAGIQNGDVVVTWGDNGTTRLSRYSAAGALLVGPTILTAPTGFYFPSDLHDSANDVILSIVHQTGTQIFNPKHLVAQKFDASHAPLWGAAPVQVFDGGSLQIGNFPTFVADGSGGAVFSWYGTGPLQVFAQHVLADGTEAFPHNGSVGSTDATRVRVSPSAAYDPLSSSTFMFWKEQDSLQSMSGVYGQKFDAAGNAQWGASGKELVVVSATQTDWIRTLTTTSGAYVFWFASTGFDQDTGQAAIVDTNGTYSVSPGAFAATPSGKLRLAAAKSAGGDALLVWSDNRVDSNDVLAQNFRSDGTLGGGPFFYCTAKASSAGCANVIGVSGAASPISLANDYAVTCANAQGAKNGLLFGGYAGPATLPFSGGTLCVTPPLKRGPIQNSGGTSPLACDGVFSTLVNDAVVPGGLDAGAGNSGWYQYWYRDPQNGSGSLGTALSNAVELAFL